MKQLLWSGLVLSCSCVFLAVTMLGASAEVDEYIRSTAPHGIRLQNIFAPADFNNNTAKVDYAAKDSDRADIVSITQGPNELGAIWSKATNKFNLRQDAHASMWLFFGDRGIQSGDGMALVLHNDPAKTNAISYKGESLGVWGQDTNAGLLDTSAVAQTAIKNSWALEFDTHVNKGTFGDAFDTDKVSGMHIASNYPNRAATYHASTEYGGILGFDKKYYYQMDHEGPISNLNLADGRWHHLSIDWQAPAVDHRIGRMTYTINDKDPKTGRKIAQAPQESVDVDGLAFDADDYKVFWGFTGATGQNFEEAYVIFEGIPELVNANVRLDLKNLTTQQTIKDGDQVLTGQKLQYNYHLTYVNGKQPWANVQADLPLGDQFKFSQGQVTYADGTTQTVTASDLQQGHLKFKLAHDLTADSPTATLTLTGTAENSEPDTIKAVQQYDQAFRGLNQIVSVDAPDYHVAGQRLVHVLLKDDLTTTTIAAKRQRNVLVTGYVFYRLGKWHNSDAKQLTATLNGHAMAIPAELKWDWQDGIASDSGKFNLVVPWRYLHNGDNQLDVTVTDQTDQVSNPIKVTMTVPSGHLGLQTVAARSAFKPALANGQSQAHVGRQSDWQVVVTDGRGTGHYWQLQAQATPPVATTGRAKFLGDVVFNDGHQDQSLTHDNVVIMAAKAASDDDQQQVVEKWTANQGVLLNVNSGALPGDYETTIKWTLNETPATE